MALAKAQHVNVDELITGSRDPSWVGTHKHLAEGDEDRLAMYNIPYSSRYSTQMTINPHHLPKDGVNSKIAYQLLHDELALDGAESLNLATFVHTWVPEECTKLMVENIGKNLVDSDEYPSLTAIHERAVSMISGLWNAPKDSTPMGTATTGSSEAIMLGGMALKRRWQERMKAAGKDIHNPGPNIVMGAEAQVALEKFARYFEVENRLVPVTAESHYVMDPDAMAAQCDENTIGIFVILGSTYTGVFENVQEMSKRLDQLQKEKGIDIPIHVDAASGGFVAPFAYPDYEWDFRIPRVHSINASGHKYGMSAVGVGWIIWRGQEYLPKDLIFELHYLGETDYSFNLNFSRPGHPILGQMFNFLNLGWNGYRAIMKANLTKARILSRALEKSGYFELLTFVHIPKEDTKGFSDEDPEYYQEGLPVISFRFTDAIKAKYPNLKQMWMQEQLRGIGWIVPNYPLPPSCEKTEILRVVIRESMSGILLRKLITDIIQTAENLFEGAGPSVAMSHAGEQADKKMKKKKKHGYSAVC